MSSSLSRTSSLDPRGVLIDHARVLPPLPDTILADPAAARVDPRAWFATSAPSPPRPHFGSDSPAAIDASARSAACAPPDHPATSIPPASHPPFDLEIGSGKGTFILAAAQREPHVNFLGIEYAREFCLFAADRLRRHGLTNVRMLCLDAAEFVHWRVPDGIVRTIHLYFPDPWPKRRHNRRRMISDRFLADAHRVLIPGGQLRVVTDHADYWTWMQEHFARAGHLFAIEDFVPAGAVTASRDEPDSAPPPLHPSPATDAGAVDMAAACSSSSGAPGGAETELVGTNFERKYRREGRTFHAAILRKIT